MFRHLLKLFLPILVIIFVYKSLYILSPNDSLQTRIKSKKKTVKTFIFLINTHIQSERLNFPFYNKYYRNDFSL